MGIDGQREVLKDKIVKISHAGKYTGDQNEFENDGVESTIPNRLKDMRRGLASKYPDVLPGEKWTPKREKTGMGSGFTPNKKADPFMVGGNDPANYPDTVQSQVESLATNAFVRKHDLGDVSLVNSLVNVHTTYYI